MNRRHVLAGALAWSLAGAARADVPDLPRVRVDRARVLRTTVGHRPYRPAGPRVEAEWIDRKLVVHHYGHGGAGMSLAWGTGWRAAKLAAAHLGRPPGRAAVLGAGVAGLCAAAQLQRLGFSVTIYARELPSATTSARSLATWSPASALIDDALIDAAFERRFAQDAAIALGELHRHVGARYGIAWRDAYTLRHSAARWSHALAERAPQIPEREVTVAPFSRSHPYVTVRPTLRVAPALYLGALLADVRAAGGRLVLRTFARLTDVLSLREPVVVNCAGLGAGPLFGDSSLAPIKGQLTVLPPQPEVRYCISSIGTPHGSFFYMIPRPDGIVLGGTSSYGDASDAIDEDAVDRVLETHRAVFER